MFKPSFILGALLALSLNGPGMAFADNASPASPFSPVPQQELLNYLAGKSELTLVDARSSAEYDAGHIYGAVSVPLDSAADALTSALPENPDSPLLVYCKTGMRAMQLQQRLTTAGYTNVRVLGPDQIMWADALPMFNCGAEAPGSTQLSTLDAKPQNGG